MVFVGRLELAQQFPALDFGSPPESPAKELGSKHGLQNLNKQLFLFLWKICILSTSVLSSFSLIHTNSHHKKGQYFFSRKQVFLVRTKPNCVFSSSLISQRSTVLDRSSSWSFLFLILRFCFFPSFAGPFSHHSVSLANALFFCSFSHHNLSFKLAFLQFFQSFRS